MDQLHLQPPLSEDQIRELVMEETFETVTKEIDEAIEEEALAEETPKPEISINLESPLSRAESPDSASSENARAVRQLRQTVSENFRGRLTKVSKRYRSFFPVLSIIFVRSILPSPSS